ncbi:HAD family hydrolase [Candidatus Clostridium radicumherbarum]|uniref:HAD family hydrolase n=1 Tax=Candidatus Clostridium radicumherbarum TaxID=3381662 RepID=A0ABW8TLT1_9CLOT
MIKNVVFDIGNVLLYFKPDEYLNGFNFDKQTNKKLFESIFKSKYWCELDRGMLTEDEAIKLFNEASPELQEKIEIVMKDWIGILKPNLETVAIVKELKKRNYNIFLLSNFHKSAFERVSSENEFFNLFDGRIISYEINLLKPEKEIYNKLLKTYNLKPEETLFIDDMIENIAAADKLRINTILFSNAESLRETLKSKRLL